MEKIEPFKKSVIELPNALASDVSTISETEGVEPLSAFEKAFDHVNRINSQPPSAGLSQLEPRPPKLYFTTIIAKAAPKKTNTGCI